MSLIALRPPPAWRTRVPAPSRLRPVISAIAFVMVVRDKPVTVERRLMPPQPKSNALSATYQRCCASLRVDSTFNQRFSSAESPRLGIQHSVENSRPFVQFILSQPLSGITQRFFQAAGQGRHRLSADEYFEPYLEDLLTIARSKGIELYNENTEKFGTRQDVVDDILALQTHEKSKGDRAKRAKPYEAIHHDVVLWHCVDDRRGAVSQGPLDATYWLVTLDFQLLGFDSFKHRGRASYVPVCIHPTVLIQLLQLWLPRDANVDGAMLNSLRSMLPHRFDTDAEEVTVKILASLSRYENSDALGEATIAEILMNQALRQRMRGEKDIDQQTKLVSICLAGFSEGSDPVSGVRRVTGRGQARTAVANEVKRRGTGRGRCRVDARCGAHSSGLLACARRWPCGDRPRPCA